MKNPHSRNAPSDSPSGTLVGTVAVAVAVLGELCLDRAQCRDRAWIRRRVSRRGSRPAEAPRLRARSVGERCQRPESCNACAAVSATISSARDTHWAACSPPGRYPAIWRSPAAQISRLCVHASGSISQIPASVSGSRQRFCDRLDGRLGGTPAIAVEVIVARGGGEQQQRLAEGVELELLVDPVTDDVGAARVPRQARAGARRARCRRSWCRPA